MLTIAGGKECTFEEFMSLGASTGWKLEKVKPGMPSVFVFVPVLALGCAKAECKL